MLEPLFRDALDAQEAPGPGYTVGIPSTAMTFLLVKINGKLESKQATLEMAWMRLLLVKWFWW